MGSLKINRLPIKGARFLVFQTKLLSSGSKQGQVQFFDNGSTLLSVKRINPTWKPPVGSGIQYLQAQGALLLDFVPRQMNEHGDKWVFDSASSEKFALKAHELGEVLCLIENPSPSQISFKRTIKDDAYTIIPKDELHYKTLTITSIEEVAAAELARQRKTSENAQTKINGSPHNPQA
eukprot:CAMPEP_0113952782 /NCGR_PEP_ID=MMETSP1339-20121228/90616_1 /TAXON_ID=94617 /ORGANISM="Fibrocapsa japonica" /LENGTH=177 /DNA_ID=CAMNT_0000961445 /DNA_START=95 /DNA_END=628 /DNA_ORIENTATION=+ /assembly_acc=CAM_ASM_000762